MGFLTGVLVFNDEVSNLRENPKLGEDLFRAVCGWDTRDRDEYITRIGRHQSRVVCQAHADYPQIVMLWQNSAYFFGDAYDKHADDVIDFAIKHLQDVKRYRERKKKGEAGR